MFIPGLYTARPVANDQSTTTDAIHPAPAVYVIVRNAETADMSEGYAVCVTADGVGAEKPTTAKLNCFLNRARDHIGLRHSRLLLRAGADLRLLADDPHPRG